MRTTVPGLTRRRFLTATAVTGAAALAVAGATTVPWAEILGSAGELDPDAGVLVVVTLYGGNDGLNMLVPAVDPAYQRMRPELAYAPGSVLDVGEGLGLNPAMTGLKRLWDTGRSMTIVRGVGYPQPDHSHFRSMAIWQTASPTSPNGAGWLGRWLDTVSDGSAADPLRALSAETVLPPLLVGAEHAGSTVGPGTLDLPKNALGRAVAGFAVPDPADDPWRAKAAASIGHLGTLRSAVDPAMSAGATATPAVARTTASQAGDLGRQLELIAGLVEARIPTRVYSASLGGFDTHADERGTQQKLLGQLDAALSGFVARLAGTAPGRQVVTLVYSEFGRRVQANASEGTDHGTASPVLLLGASVPGGFVGEQPSLTDLDAGDLRAHVDFRDVYATLTEQVLGADAGRIVPGGTPGEYLRWL
jgi:uncharacterized protein (DUF1501 family)